MTLHPKAVAFIEELAASGAPGWSELPVAESRDIFNGFTDLFGAGPELHCVEDIATHEGVPLRVFRPFQSSVPTRAVVYFHGGGWVLGSVQTHDTLCRRLAAASGRIVISVDYRLAPEHPYPAAFEDAYEATLFAASQADRLGLDPDQISVAGDSAGANLAAAVALRLRNENGPRLQSQVLIYPVVEPNFETPSYQAFATDHVLTRESMQWFWRQYVPQLADAVAADLAYASLMDADLAGLPPTFVLTAEYDVLRDEGERFAERLAAAGVPLARKRFEGMLHGFVHFSGLYEDGIRALEEIGAFLRR